MASKSKTMNEQNHASLHIKQTPVFWYIAIALLIFFLFMPFQQALINSSNPADEPKIFYSFLIGAALLIGLAIHHFINRSTSNIVQYFIWLMPLIYLLSSLGAVSDYHAYREFSIWILYAIFFTVAYQFTQFKNGQQAAYYIVMGTASIIVIFGMMNWFGDASLWGLLPWDVYSGATQLHGEDMRLTSIFQYANTYAAFLMAFVFMCLAAMTLAKNKVSMMLGAFMIVPALLSFIFTLSRGAWVMFPVVFIVILPLLRISKQIQFICYLVISAIASAIALPTINRLGLSLQNNHTAGEAFKAWAILIATSVIVALLTYIVHTYIFSKLDRKLEKWNNRKLFNFILPIVAVIVGAIGAYLLLGNTGFTKMLPDSIRHRVESINFNQHSVLERGTFYEDALKIWSDYPIIGAGGGAWEALYQQYQQNPYTSSVVHSFYLETLLEIGLLGILVLFILIIAIYYFFIRSFLKKASEEQFIPYIWFIISTSFFIHSILDFNMSFIYVGALVFFSLGAMLSASNIKSWSWQDKLSLSKWKLTVPSILLVIGLWFGISNIVHATGYQQYKKTYLAISDQAIQTSIDQLDTAIARNSNPNYVDVKLQLLNQAYEQTLDEQFANEAQDILNEMNKQEPYFENFIYRQLELNKLQNNEVASIELLNNSIVKFPWEIDYYQKLAAIHFQLALSSLDLDQIDETKAHLQSIFTIRDQVQSLSQQLALLPEEQLQGRVFTITPALALSIGQAHYVLGEYEQAEAYLALAYNPSFSEDTDATAAVYYSAVLQKLNRPYEEVANVLYAAFPEQQQNLEGQIYALSIAEPIQ